MSENTKEMLITSIILGLLLILLSGCSSIDVEHQHGKMPKISLESETLDKICTKDFDADVKTDQFILSCDIAL